MARWLVTGSGGMLGQDVCAALSSAGIAFTPSRSADLDIRDAGACLDAVGQDILAIATNGSSSAKTRLGVKNINELLNEAEKIFK